MPKPVADTKWSLTGTKVEPSSGQKDAGWAVGQKPPAQWLNWWMDAVDQWKVWLAAFETTAHSWTALQTFAAGIVVTQSAANTRGILSTGTGSGEGIKGIGGATAGAAGVVGVGGAGGAPGGSFTGTVGGNGIESFGNAGGAGAFLLGGAGGAGASAVGGAGGIGVVGTAGAGGAQGLYGDGGTSGNGAYGTNSSATLPAVLGENTAAGPGVKGSGATSANAVGIAATLKPAAAASGRALKVFLETAGSPNVPDATMKAIIAEVFGALQFGGDNPTAITAFKNCLSPLNIPKAWAVFQCNGTGACDLIDGFNINSITQAVDGLITVTFQEPMADGNYLTQQTVYAATSFAYWAAVDSGDRDTSDCIVSCYKFSDSSQPDRTALNGKTFSLLVFGRQGT